MKIQRVRENQEKVQKNRNFNSLKVKTPSLVTLQKKNPAKVAQSPKPSSTRSFPIAKLNSPTLKTKRNQKYLSKGVKPKQKQAKNVTDIRRYFESFTAENNKKNPPEEKPPDNPNCRAASEAKTPNQSGPKFTLSETSRNNQGEIKGKYMGNFATSLSSSHATDFSELDQGTPRLSRPDDQLSLQIDLSIILTVDRCDF